MPATNLPFDVYVRVSRVNGRDGDSFISPADQEARCRALATARGLDVGEVFTDLDQSGGKMNRPEFENALARIAGGESAGLLVAKLDRFARTVLGGLQALADITSTGGQVLSADGTLDTTTDAGKIATNVLLTMGEIELDRHRRQWKVAVDGAIERGIYVGPLPVGYTKDEVTKRLAKNQHAPAVEHAFSIRANGGSWSEAGRALTNADVPTSTGQARWGINSVRSLVQNPIYKGELKNGHRHQFAEYAIVTPSVWAKAQGSDATPGRKDAGAWAVLGGLVFCGGCGHRMTPHFSTDKRKPNDHRIYRYYVCNNVGKCDERARITPGELEPLVCEAAYDYFATYIEQTGMGQDTDIEKLAALEIARDEAQRRFAAWEATSDPLDPGYAERKLALRDAIQAAETAVVEERAASRRFPTAEEVRAVIDTGTVEEKRHVLRQVLHGVTVWRDGVEPHGEELRGEPITHGEELRGEVAYHRVEVAYRTLVWGS